MLLRYFSLCFVCEVETVMQDDIYASLTKFEVYAKELATKMLGLKNDINYSEPESDTGHSLEED